MKRFGIVMVFLAVMSVFTIAHAEVREGAFSMGINAGGYFFEGNQDYKDNYTYGVRGGYNFTKNYGVELFLNHLPTEFEDTGRENKVYFGSIEGLYHFTTQSRLVPFLAIGVGVIHYTSDDPRLKPSKYTVDYGAGLKYFVTENVSLRADVRHILPLGEKDEYGDNPHSIHNDLFVALGISLDFGGDKKETVKSRVE